MHECCRVFFHRKQYKTFNLLRRGIFRQYGIKEVKNYIKTHLPKFQDFSKEKLMLEYLHVVEHSEKFSVHTFTVYKVRFDIKYLLFLLTAVKSSNDMFHFSILACFNLVAIQSKWKKSQCGV